MLGAPAYFLTSGWLLSLSVSSARSSRSALSSAAASSSGLRPVPVAADCANNHSSRHISNQSAIQACPCCPPDRL